jgi:hypothetical protein
MMNLLRQLGLDAVEVGGRKRVLLVLDFPEHGGARLRDAAVLTGDDLRDCHYDLRRLRAQDLRRQGYTWGGRKKGNTKRKVAIAAALRPSPTA